MKTWTSEEIRDRLHAEDATGELAVTGQSWVVAEIAQEMRQLLADCEAAIGTYLYIPNGGPGRDAAIRLQERLRKHLGIEKPADSGSAGGGV